MHRRCDNSSLFVSDVREIQNKNRVVDGWGTVVVPLCSFAGDANVLLNDCIELHLVNLTSDFLSSVSILTSGIDMGILSPFVCSSVRLCYCVETVIIC